MEKKIIEFNQSQRALKDAQEFHSGDVVKVFLRIKEGAKERTQLFEGLIIAVKGRQSSSPTITVRKVTHDIGVEMIIPIGSKNVEKIELVKRAKVRRAKLYFVRTLTTKQSRMKYKDIKDVNKKDKPKPEKAPVKIEEKKEVAVAEKVEEKKVA
ncbi:MAG: 50S ribosomal protein L19 [Candidatus Moraniibacteriota bacterium]